MKAVVQRVIDASVTVNGLVKGAVKRGLVVYLGIARDDTPRDMDWIVDKVANLRIFDDSEGRMNRSLIEIVNQHDTIANHVDVNHNVVEVNVIPIGVLAISQFTLLGDARKGRRPSWNKAAPPEAARELYAGVIEKMSAILPCTGGEFQSHMMVRYTNDGPVTILLDSKEIAI